MHATADEPKTTFEPARIPPVFSSPAARKYVRHGFASTYGQNTRRVFISQSISFCNPISPGRGRSFHVGASDDCASVIERL